jgi:class 3 adenylate cyclase/tetratricopeptide (TPR) repeat protein
MKSFAQWLHKIGLASYTAAFAENEVDFSVVSMLTEEDLRDLGLSLGARKKFLSAAAAHADSAKGERGTAARSEPLLVPSATPASSAGDRRQLTVMFCDLVGSTALSEKLDPEELRSLLHDYRTQCGEVIARYDGFVARYVGDGILTYFGWPKAHEEDAERSLRAALEIVQAVKGASSAESLSVRIGIATGPVVVGEQAGVGDQSKLAIGSTPNLAARLQALAAADQIVIASSTRRLVGNAFELADLGDHELKGISEPVHAWRVIAVGQAASRFEAATQGVITPMVGREQELGLLLDRWQQAQDGEGQVVLLSGEPGIGKSRIVDALREWLEAQGRGMLRFQCSPYYVNSAFYPTIDYFERALKFGRDETVDSKLDKLEALVVGQYGRPLSDVRFIASMLSIPCDARYGAISMTPQKQKSETLRALVDLTEAAARKRPSVALYEDMHWADPTSLEAMDLLVDRVRTMPLLIVLTHRPEFQPKWESRGHLTVLNLSRLTRAQSGAIVSKLAGGKPLPDDLLKKILAKTDGVPLYVEELTKSILESGELKDVGDHYDYAGAARSITIPATLRDSLTARLDRSHEAKEIAQIGAAIGREFSYELIAAVAPHTHTELDSSLNQLTESGLAFRRGTPPAAAYTFKHALVQDAAYDSLLKSRRQALHAKIARILQEHFPAAKNTEPELLAHHLTAAGETEAAIGYWQKAGELALKRLALNEAISHLNKGMEIIGTLPQSPERDGKELDLRTPLGAAWLALKGWAAPEVWSSFHPALGLAKSLSRHETLLPIYYGLYISVQTQGRVAESLDWVNEMLATAQASGDRDLLILGHRAACTAYFWLGDLTQSREHGDRVLALYNDEQHRHLADVMNSDPRTVAGMYLSFGAWMLGFPDRAVQLSAATDTHARRRGNPLDLGIALYLGCWIWDYRCEPERFLARGEEAERLGRAHSLPFVSEVLAQFIIGNARLGAGRFAEGIPHLREAIENSNANGGLTYLPYLRARLAEGFALSGDLEGGLRLIEESLAQIARPGWKERSHLAEVLRLKAWMLQQQGKLAAAEDNYLASIDFAREQRAKSWELRTSTSLVRLWRSQGKHKEALDLLKPLYNWFTEGFDTKDLKDAKALLDELQA